MIEFIDSNSPHSGLRNVIFTYRKMFEQKGLSSYLTTLHFDRNIKYDEPVIEYPHMIGSGFTLNLIYDTLFPYSKNDNIKIYNTTILKPKKERSFVLIHDLYFDQSPIRIIKFKHHYVLDYMLKHNIPFITVSNYTAEKLRKIGLDGIVIHPLPYDLLPLTQKENIILMVGSQEARKNIEFMNSFTSPSFLNHNTYHPVKVGGGVRFAMNFLNLSNEDLDKLYSESKFLLFPSLDEGFGLPVLEALLHRCIVVSNDIPTSREIDMGHDIIEFIDVKNFDFSKVSKLLESVENTTRDYDSWFKDYKARSENEVKEFKEYVEKMGWMLC